MLAVTALQDVPRAGIYRSMRVSGCQGSAGTLLSWETCWMSRPTAGAISQFRVPRLLILPSQIAPLAHQAHPQVSVVLQCGPPRQGSDTQCGTGVLPSLPFQFPLVKVLHLPSSKGTEGPGWGWGCGYRGHSGPPLTLPLHPSSPERQSCLTCQAPQLRGLGANLVTHGFLVLLVGGFHRGSGGANVDLGRRGGSGSRVFAIMEQVSHQRELETNRGRRWRTRALELYAACTLSKWPSKTCHRELETHVHTNACTPVSVAASFLVAPKQEQSKHPSTAERINRM